MGKSIYPAKDMTPSILIFPEKRPIRKLSAADFFSMKASAMMDSPMRIEEMMQKSQSESMTWKGKIH